MIDPQKLQLLREIADGKKQKPRMIISQLITDKLIEAERNYYEDADEFPYHYYLTDAGRAAIGDN